MHLYLKYQSPNTFGLKDIAQVKIVQNQVKDQGQKVKQKSWYHKKGLFIMHLYLKYQSPTTFGSKDTAQVKVF
jgi:pantothenate synthetase